MTDLNTIDTIDTIADAQTAIDALRGQQFFQADEVLGGVVGSVTGVTFKGLNPLVKAHLYKSDTGEFLGKTETPLSLVHLEPQGTYECHDPR